MLFQPSIAPSRNPNAERLWCFKSYGDTKARPAGLEPATCSTDRPTSKMLPRDLESARKNLDCRGQGRRGTRAPREVRLPSIQELQGSLRRFPRHAHTFITNLCRANVSPKTALARHSDIRLTMNVYTHIDQQEQAAAIGMLKGVEGVG